MINKKQAQEEMLGFALIIILVSVILLIILGLSFRGGQKDLVESYEVESFIQVMLQYTTECETNLEFLSLQKLIRACVNNDLCLDGQNSCDVLENNIEEILDSNWNLEDESTIQGYEFSIFENNETLVTFTKGNSTNNNKGSLQDFSYNGKLISIVFTAHY